MMTKYRLMLAGCTFTVKMIDIGIYFFDRCLFQRYIQPDHILLNNVEIVFDRMQREVATLKMSPKVNNYMGHLHRILLLIFVPWP